jgi:parallel beta-helix repeat protein
MPKKDKKTKKSWKEKLRERQLKHQKALENYRIQREREAARKPRRWSKGKILMALCLVVIVFGAFGVWQSTQPYNETNQPNIPSEGEQTQPSTWSTIYIRPNGNIEPSTAQISKIKSNQYKFTADIYLPIVVEKDNIVIEGAGHTLQGSNVYGSKGIDLTDRNNVTVKNLTIKGFDYGIYVVSASNNILLQNVLTENYCGIWLSYSLHNLIASNTITKNKGYGIWLKDSSANKIYENEIASHGNYTIYIGSSSNNTIYRNIIKNNTLGIFLYMSTNNTISENSVTKNHQGIHLSSSSQNHIIKNNFENNDCGLSFSESSSNTIYYNNFIDNVKQVYVTNSVNHWDNGYEGNYWSDYKNIYPDAEELDSSGIWNTPYIIDENNQDRYPKIKPNS